MPAAFVDSRGRITLPKEVRRRLHIAPGDHVNFVETQEGGLSLIAATREVRELKGLISKPARKVSVARMARAVARRGARR